MAVRRKGELLLDDISKLRDRHVSQAIDQLPRIAMGDPVGVCAPALPRNDGNQVLLPGIAARPVEAFRPAVDHEPQEEHAGIAREVGERVGQALAELVVDEDIVLADDCPALGFRDLVQYAPHALEVRGGGVPAGHRLPLVAVIARRRELERRHHLGPVEPVVAEAALHPLAPGVRRRQVDAIDGGVHELAPYGPGYVTGTFNRRRMRWKAQK